MKYLNGSTGGSTGNTLQYRMHLKDYELGVSVTYRGWGYAGYKPGDKVAVIAGASLISNPKQNIVEKLQALFMNMHFYSSYGMNEEVFYNYYRSIKKNKPKFIRGYASSVYLFAKFIQRKNLSLNFTIETSVPETYQWFLDGNLITDSTNSHCHCKRSK